MRRWLLSLLFGRDAAYPEHALAAINGRLDEEQAGMSLYPTTGRGVLALPQRSPRTVSAAEGTTGGRASDDYTF